MASKITTTTLYRMKKEGKKITALTAYDYPFARMVDASGIEMVLVTHLAWWSRERKTPCL